MSTPVASTAGPQVDHKDPTARADIVATMSVDTAPNPETTRPRTGPVLDVVVPVYNEESDLEPSVRRLHAYLTAEFPYPFRITIADNASVDATPAIATRLAAQLPEVESLRMPERAAAGRCGPRGPRPTHRCWPTATWTSPPTSPRSCRWWPR